MKSVTSGLFGVETAKVLTLKQAADNTHALRKTAAVTRSTIQLLFKLRWLQ